MTHRFNPTSLREYDIRGIVGETLGPDDARAIGRGFGSGTFGAATAFSANAANPTTDARPMASTDEAGRAVLRDAAAGGEEVTTLLRGESLGRLRASQND